MSEQTSERERLIAHLLLSEEYLGSVSDDTVAMLRADAAETAALRQRVETCEKDAARYRWLRDKAQGWEWRGMPHPNLRMEIWTSEDTRIALYGNHMDAIVDQVMRDTAPLAHSTPAPVNEGKGNGI